MHDIWNPWHGCIKKSEGCQNCYMYYLDKIHGNRDSSEVYRAKAGFKYPLSKYRGGGYKVKSGEMLRVCMTSDFFIEEADAWRDEAWDIMRQRRDVVFFLLTKRPERVAEHLPWDWGDGWENIFFNVTTENQVRADERIPIMLELPFKHKGIMCAPFIGPVSIRKYLEEAEGQIELVTCDGENYEGARPLDFDWVKKLRQECVDYDTTFCFYSIGNHFIKDGKHYHISDGATRSLMAYKSGMNYQGRGQIFKLYDEYGWPIGEDNLYQRHFREQCDTCPMKLTCNGCSDCGRCG